MNFKLFFKYHLLLQLLLGSSLSFGGDNAFSLRSSSQSDSCVEKIEINAPMDVEVDCQKTGNQQTLKLSTFTVKTNNTTSRKLNVTTFPYISDGKIIGGVTDISGDKTIYAASLHMFLNHWDNKQEAFNSYLQNTIPLLVSIHSDRSQYFDLILFIDQSLLDNIPSHRSSEELAHYIKKAIAPKIKLKSQQPVTPGLEWISPNQFSKIANDSSIANSSGTVAQLVTQTLNNQSFSEFYLSNDSNNFSTAGSSGSVIFDSQSHLPLGLLQCQMTKNLIVNGVEQNTKGLYKILSFDILKEFNLQLIDINQLTQHLTPDSIKSDASCSWRDGKGGG